MCDIEPGERAARFRYGLLAGGSGLALAQNGRALGGGGHGGLELLELAKRHFAQFQAIGESRLQDQKFVGEAAQGRLRLVGFANIGDVAHGGLAADPQLPKSLVEFFGLLAVALHVF